MEQQKTTDNQSSLRKRNKARGVMLTDFKLYYKAIVMKTQYCNKSRPIDQWNRMQSSEINPHVYDQLQGRRQKYMIYI